MIVCNEIEQAKNNMFSFKTSVSTASMSWASLASKYVTNKVWNWSIPISAYNGSLISSLTTPELDKQIETNRELLDHADKIAIISIKNTAAPQYMAKSSNIYLRRLQQISDATGRNNATDVTQTIDYVIEHPYTSCFAVAIDFQLRINPPTGDKISKDIEPSRADLVKLNRNWSMIVHKTKTIQSNFWKVDGLK